MGIHVFDILEVKRLNLFIDTTRYEAIGLCEYSLRYIYTLRGQRPLDNSSVFVCIISIYICLLFICLHLRKRRPRTWMDAYTAELADTGCQDGRACGQLIDEMNAQAKIPNRSMGWASPPWTASSNRCWGPWTGACLNIASENFGNISSNSACGATGPFVSKFEFRGKQECASGNIRFSQCFCFFPKPNKRKNAKHKKHILDIQNVLCFAKCFTFLQNT